MKADVLYFSRLHLTRLRAAWLVLIAVLFAMLLLGLWIQFTDQTRLEQQVNTAVTPEVALVQLTAGAITALLVVFIMVVSTVIVWKAEAQPIGLLLALTMLFYWTTDSTHFDVLTLPEYTPLATFFRPPILFMRAAALPLALVLLFTFPDGHFLPRWSRWLVAGYSLLTLAYLLLPALPTNTIYGPTWRATPEISLIVSSVPFLIGVYAQFRRYRSTAPAQRNQIKWTALGMSIMVIGILLYYGLYVLLNQPFKPFLTPADLIAISALDALRQFTQLVLAVILPSLCFMIAIFRYRLWSADPVINRVLVYTALLGSLSLIYIVSILLIGTLFNTINFVVSIPVTIGIVVIFQPLRDRIQITVNRLMFGERDNPYAVITQVSTEVQTSPVDSSALSNIAELLAQTLSLPYVAITLKPNIEPFAVYGKPFSTPIESRFSIIYSQQHLGDLVVWQDAGDRVLSAQERHLIENIARQIAGVVHVLQLNRDLQHSRQQIVTAREEERRRLRRDLHDGLGPTLASHALKVGKARSLIAKEPELAARVLNDLDTDISHSLTEIRRLVYALRPPVLDQLGLIGALRTFIDTLEGSESEGRVLQFEMRFPVQLEKLPAAVEVAAYRIISEAVTNVVRHAAASRCLVVINLDGALILTVSDNGRGFLPEMRYGVGLNSIRERAEEVGGKLTLENTVPHGVYLTARSTLR